MSSARKIEVYRLHGDRESMVAQRSNSTLRVEVEQYKQLRKAIAVDVPLTRTLRWIEKLPPKMRPTALLRSYPRVANLLAATWSDPKSFGAYMDSLLEDRRGNRRGFPLQVAAELIALKRYRENGAGEDNDLALRQQIGKRG